MRRGWDSGACTAWWRIGFRAPHSHPLVLRGDCEDTAALFMVVHCDRMSDNRDKSKQKRFRLGMRINFSHRDSQALRYIA